MDAKGSDLEAEKRIQLVILDMSSKFLSFNSSRAIALLKYELVYVRD